MKQFREIKIIKQESEASTKSSMNILPVNTKKAKLIFVSECYEKIEVGGDTVLQSPNGNYFKLEVSNEGVLSVKQIIDKPV